MGDTNLHDIRSRWDRPAQTCFQSKLEIFEMKRAEECRLTQMAESNSWHLAYHYRKH